MTDREKIISDLEKCLDDSVAAVVPADTVREALALLKAQEPRVMKEVELREIQDEIPVWIEVPFEGCDFGHWVLVSYQHYEYKGLKYSFDEGALDGMGVKWRCWTSRPTEEQREAVKWE